MSSVAGLGRVLGSGTPPLVRVEPRQWNLPIDRPVGYQLLCERLQRDHQVRGKSTPMQLSGRTKSGICVVT
jgi:hypothetical protein